VMAATRPHDVLALLPWSFIAVSVSNPCVCSSEARLGLGSLDLATPVPKGLWGWDLGVARRRPMHFRPVSFGSTGPGRACGQINVSADRGGYDDVGTACHAG
jgi:hypothetical protein